MSVGSTESILISISITIYIAYTHDGKNILFEYIETILHEKVLGKHIRNVYTYTQIQKYTLFFYKNTTYKNIRFEKLKN